LNSVLKAQRQPVILKAVSPYPESRDREWGEDD
jgi:hypothetical protein